jgi:beta-barrel assembly-enhancing protease
MRTLLLALSLVVCVPAFAQLDLGRIINRAVDTGRKLAEANRDMTAEEEVALGEGITMGFLGASPLHGDASLQRYVNRIGRWLASNSGRPDLPWSFGVIDTETLNAFAMPGGAVIVSSGLLRRLGGESELAGVLAHEVAHVVKRHQLAAIQSSANTNILGDVLKDEAAARIGRGRDVAGLKRRLNDAGFELAKSGVILRPLDRSMEYEADRLGVVIAARSGYDPYGLVAVLSMLAQAKGDGSGASIFDTHPAAAERIAELEKFVPSVLDQYAAQPRNEARFRQAVKALR